MCSSRVGEAREASPTVNRFLHQPVPNLLRDGPIHCIPLLWGDTRQPPKTRMPFRMEFSYQSIHVRPPAAGALVNNLGMFARTFEDSKEIRCGADASARRK